MDRIEGDSEEWGLLVVQELVFILKDSHARLEDLLMGLKISRDNLQEKSAFGEVFSSIQRVFRVMNSSFIQEITFEGWFHDFSLFSTKFTV